MKTQFLPALILCLFAFNLPAQTPELPAPEKTTSIQVEEETFDFGNVREGEHVTKVFTFTNTGNEPLIIQNAKGSCGCTVPQYPGYPVLPGETASVTVEFDTRGKTGAQMKKVTITANTNPQQTFLYIKGEVIPAGALHAEDMEVEEEDQAPRPDCFEIAPNPTAEILSLKIDETRYGKPATVSVFSVSGELMAQRHFAEAPRVVEFEVSHYPAGVYVARVQADDGVEESQCFLVSR